MGRVRVEFGFCYDKMTIFDANGKKRYRFTSSFHACLLCTYIYFNITPLYKEGKKNKDQGFGFRYETLPLQFRESNLVDAIYIYFP
jgi:hypothetical protein